MVAIEWWGEDDGGGVVIVGTGACDGTVCVVCADGSKSVCVDGKDGSECDVGCYIDKSGVVGVIVGPADEVVALVGDGTDLDGCVVVVDTGSVDWAHGAIVGVEWDCVCVDSEESYEGCVTSNGEWARVVLVSVGPLDKVVSISGGGGNVGSCAKVVDAAAVGSAYKNPVANASFEF